jgi:hypothetical protein
MLISADDSDYKVGGDDQESDEAESSENDDPPPKTKGRAKGKGKGKEKGKETEKGKMGEGAPAISDRELVARVFDDPLPPLTQSEPATTQPSPVFEVPSSPEFQEGSSGLQKKRAARQSRKIFSLFSNKFI